MRVAALPIFHPHLNKTPQKPLQWGKVLAYKLFAVHNLDTCGRVVGADIFRATPTYGGPEVILIANGVPLIRLRPDEVARLNAEARSQNISMRDLIHKRFSAPDAALPVSRNSTSGCVELDPELATAVAWMAIIKGECSVDDHFRAVLLP